MTIKSRNILASQLFWVCLRVQGSICTLRNRGLWTFAGFLSKDQIIDLNVIKTRQGKLHCLAYTPLIDGIFRRSRLRGKLPRLATLDSTVQGYGRRTLSPVWRRNRIYGGIFGKALPSRVATVRGLICSLRHVEPIAIFIFVITEYTSEFIVW